MLFLLDLDTLLKYLLIVADNLCRETIFTKDDTMRKIVILTVIVGLLGVPNMANATVTVEKIISPPGETICGQAGCFTTTGIELKTIQHFTPTGGYGLTGTTESWVFRGGKRANRATWEPGDHQAQNSESTYASTAPVAYDALNWTLYRYTLKDLDMTRCTTIRDTDGTYWSVDIPEVERETKYQCDSVTQLALEVVRKNKARKGFTCTIKKTVAACKKKGAKKAILRTERDTSIDRSIFAQHKAKQVRMCGHIQSYGSFFVIGNTEAACAAVKDSGTELTQGGFLMKDLTSLAGYPCHQVGMETVCDISETDRVAFRFTDKIPNDQSVHADWDRDLGIWWSNDYDLVK